MPRLQIILLLVPLLLATGCAQVEKDKKRTTLDAAVTAYGSALRWGYFETASGFLHPDHRDGAARADWGKDLRILSYDVVQPAMLSDEDTANQVVQIEYLHEDRQRVRRMTDRQAWRYDEGSGNWWLHSGLPPFE